MKKYEVLTDKNATYMTTWHQDGRLNMQLHMAQHNPIIHLDARVLPQLIEHLKSIQREIKGPFQDIVVEGNDEPTTNLGEAW